MPLSNVLSLTYFYREPRKTGLSIEGIFNLVGACLQEKVIIKSFYCNPALSRFQNTLRARKAASEINHITGDVNFLAIALHGKKNILTIHDLGHYDTLKKRNFLQFKIYGLFWFTLPLRFIDVVTVVSQFTKDKLIEYFHFPEDKIRLIHDPVKKVFRFTPKVTISFPPVILMMGTGKHKNLDNLIEAARLTDVHIDIIGWPATDELEKLNTCGVSYTIYNGLTDEEVYERYVACDILFMASFYEGFGMPIIEAQSVGRPVITSNIGAMLELGEESAFLVDPHKPEEIKEAIISLQDPELYHEFVALGRINAEKYAYEKIAEQYLDVYRELASQK